MSRCCVPLCFSAEGTEHTDKDITFHEFPEDPELKTQWISAIPNCDMDLASCAKSRVCSLHFQLDNFSSDKILLSDVIPSVFSLTSMDSLSTGLSPEKKPFVWIPPQSADPALKSNVSTENNKTEVDKEDSGKDKSKSKNLAEDEKMIEGLLNEEETEKHCGETDVPEEVKIGEKLNTLGYNTSSLACSDSLKFPEGLIKDIFGEDMEVAEEVPLQKSLPECKIILERIQIPENVLKDLRKMYRSKTPTKKDSRFADESDEELTSAIRKLTNDLEEKSKKIRGKPGTRKEGGSPKIRRQTSKSSVRSLVGKKGSPDVGRSPKFKADGLSPKSRKIDPKAKKGSPKFVAGSAKKSVIAAKKNKNVKISDAALKSKVKQTPQLSPGGKVVEKKKTVKKVSSPVGKESTVDEGNIKPMRSGVAKDRESIVKKAISRMQERNTIIGMTERAGYKSTTPKVTKRSQTPSSKPRTPALSNKTKTPLKSVKMTDKRSPLDTLRNGILKSNVNEIVSVDPPLVENEIESSEPVTDSESKIVESRSEEGSPAPPVEDGGDASGIESQVEMAENNEEPLMDDVEDMMNDIERGLPVKERTPVKEKATAKSHLKEKALKEKALMKERLAFKAYMKERNVMRKPRAFKQPGPNVVRNPLSGPRKRGRPRLKRPSWDRRFSGESIEYVESVDLTSDNSWSDGYKRGFSPDYYTPPTKMRKYSFENSKENIQRSKRKRSLWLEKVAARAKLQKNKYNPTLKVNNELPKKSVPVVDLDIDLDTEIDSGIPGLKLTASKKIIEMAKAISRLEKSADRLHIQLTEARMESTKLRNELELYKNNKYFQMLKLILEDLEKGHPDALFAADLVASYVSPWASDNYL